MGKLYKAMTINKDKLKTRKETLDGIEYLVAPVVMVKEQVLNGELLPAEEIAKSALGWNGRPVVVYHPQDKNGNDVIANDPEIVPKYEVGKVYNVEYDEKTTKLKGEVWVDISKAKRKNKDTKLALQMIEDSDALEVSTGYIVNDRFSKKGEFDGVEYSAIQRDILPDHLALLPQEIGACSWEDGAGVRNNSKGLIGWLKKLVDNISSRGSIQSQVANKLREEYDDFDWVNDLIHDDDTGQDFAVFYTRPIYDEEEPGKVVTQSKMYAIAYEFDDTGSVVLGDTLQEVESVQQYISKNNSKEEQTLNKHENLVRDVIANSKGKLGRKDKSTLMNCSESALLSMLPEAKKKAYLAANKSSKAGKAKIATNADVITNLFGGATYTTNEGEEAMVSELVEMGASDAESAIEGVDTATLESIADTIVEALNAADLVVSIVEDPAPVEEAIASAEEVLAVVEDAISAGGTGEEEPAANMDTSDIMDPPEDGEEETVGALETASRRIRKNAKARQRTNAGAKKAAAKKQMSINDYINSIPDPEAREFIKNGVAESKRHRQSLLTDLAGNKNCQFSEAELKKMETNQLEKIHAMCGTPSRRQPATNTSYAARGMQTNASKGEEEGDFVPLTTNIFKKEDK